MEGGELARIGISVFVDMGEVWGSFISLESLATDGMGGILETTLFFFSELALSNSSCSYTSFLQPLLIRTSET